MTDVSYMDMQIFVSLNSTGIPAWLFYVHDRTMTTLDYAGDCQSPLFHIFDPLKLSNRSLRWGLSVPADLLEPRKDL